jgi:rubrerythrin
MAANSDAELERSETYKNLRTSYFEEASLAFRYRFFAIIAEFEGLDSFAALFKQMAEGGTMSAHGALDLLRGTRDPDSAIPTGGTQQNLESLLQTEIKQYTESYPAMAQIARDEGFTDVASWFDTLEKLKRSHVQKLKRLKDGKSHD